MKETYVKMTTKRRSRLLKGGSTIDFWDIQCFVYTAEELSFTRAAQRLFISQQTLSARISRLENQYQVKLFERTTPLKLTPAGTYLFKNGRTLMRFQTALDSGMQSIRKNGNSMLGIGIILNRATVIIQKTVPLFQKQNPNVSVRVIEMPDTDLSSALQSQPIDLLVGYRLNANNISFVPLYEEQYYLCVPESIFRAQFTAEERMRILSEPVAHMHDFVRCPLLTVRYMDFLVSVFKKCCEEANVIPQIAVETTSIMTRLSLCASGLGIMFLSKSLYQQAISMFKQEILDEIHFIPICYQPEYTYRQLGVNYLSERGLNTVERSFIETAQKALAETENSTAVV